MFPGKPIVISTDELKNNSRCQNKNQIYGTFNYCPDFTREKSI
jgi:hypothetical protein